MLDLPPPAEEPAAPISAASPAMLNSAPYESSRVNALYAVLALLPTLGREELTVIQGDVHARLALASGA